MKKLTLVLLALCLALTVFAAVACTPSDSTDESTDTPVSGGDGTLEPDTQGGDVAEDPSGNETIKDAEDDAFISVNPTNEEQIWGEVNVKP